MNRGDVYWVALDPTRGSEINKKRPCVIISESVINKIRHTVVVVPLSSSAKARPPIVISVKCLGSSVTAVCDQIRAVDKTRLIQKADQLNNEDMQLLGESLRQILSL